MVGKLAPNSPHFTRGLVTYIPGRGYFRAVPSQNGDKCATSPTPPIVKRPVPSHPGHMMLPNRCLTADGGNQGKGGLVNLSGNRLVLNDSEEVDAFDGGIAFIVS